MAARWMGWQNIWHSEIDEFCNEVMEKHFPDSENYGDIKTKDWSQATTVELVTGGEPCQPHSIAGLKNGTADERYLWPEFIKAIRAIKPKWVINENVPGSIGNAVIDKKIADLETEGYTCWTPFVLSASAVDAPHRRDRIWTIANSDSIRLQRNFTEPQTQRNADGQFAETDWQNHSYSSRICRVDDGISDRVDRVKAIGNAVVPQVVLRIYRMIAKCKRV